jgi:DNA-binding Lrp family transcriptional regulator
MQEIEEGLAMFFSDKPKEIPSVLSGFTPAPDVLIKKYGYVTALVWGRVWRYCQGPQGECSASLETISGELNMSVRNVLRDIKELCRDGYLRDTTPDRRNKPHIYADTHKIRIRISVEAAVTDSHPAMTQSHGTMTDSHPHHDSESLEESIKKQSKKQKKKQEGASAEPKITDVPELVIYRSVVKHWCKPFQRAAVVDAIQKVSKRLGRLASAADLNPFFDAWAKVSGNDWSLVWLSEWAVSGQIPSRNGKPMTAAQSGDNSKYINNQYADYIEH